MKHEVRNILGDLVATHERKGPWEPKGVRPKELPLYGTHLMPKWNREAPVFIVEGEKCAEVLWARGYQALGTYGATMCPIAAVLEPLRGWHVVLWPDNDEPGRAHMARIAELLAPIVASLRRLDWEDVPKGDAADYFGGAA
jgi:DNA primase